MSDVLYFRNPDPVGTVVSFMTNLHTRLIASGWTQEYIDADGIGGGTTENPAWDKTPANSTDAGIVVYKMPALDELDTEETEWYIRLRPGWFAATGRPQIRGVTIGTSVDGSGNVSGGPSEYVAQVNTSTTSTISYTISAYKHGFYFASHSASGTSLHIERLSDYEDTELSNHLHMSYHVLATGAASFYAKIDKDSGSEIYNYAFFLLNYDGAAATVQNTPTTSREGLISYVVGPFAPGGDPLHWHPRLACLIANNEAAANQDFMIQVNGSYRLYRAEPINLSTTFGRRVIATE